MSEAEDVQAIQTYLKNASTQVSAAVASCTTLDQASKDGWYALAARILPYVSQTPAPLAMGRALRTDLNEAVQSLAAKGCGNLPQLIHDAPPPVPAPPPKGTPNPLLSNPLFAMLEGPQLPWLLIGAWWLFFRKGRR